VPCPGSEPARLDEGLGPDVPRSGSRHEPSDPGRERRGGCGRRLGQGLRPRRAWARLRHADGSWGWLQVLPAPAEGELLQAALDGAGAMTVSGVTIDQRVWAAHADVEDDWTVSTLHAAPSPP
jgi:hypothetical protein